MAATAVGYAHAWHYWRSRMAGTPLRTCDYCRITEHYWEDPIGSEDCPVPFRADDAGDLRCRGCDAEATWRDHVDTCGYDGCYVASCDPCGIAAADCDPEDRP